MGNRWTKPLSIVLAASIVMPTAAWTAPLTAAASNGNGVGASKQTQIPVANVKLAKKELHLQGGQSEQLEVTVLPPTTANKKVVWSSSNTKVATVMDGLVKAVGPGEAVITAYSEANPNKQDSIRVKVSAIAVTGITLSSNEVELFPGQRSFLSAEVLPAYASNTQVQWSSSNPEVAVVENGVVTGVATGTATITATSAADSSITAAANVSVTTPVFREASVHDPSIIKVDDTYYVFGSHLAAAKTKDFKTWTRFAEGVNANNPLFNNVLVDLKEAFDWTGVQGLWAADVIQLADGKFYMYYNSCEGSSPVSALGIAVADNIEGPYVNQSIFLRSGKGKAPDGVANYNAVQHPNAIDPDVFFDKDGKLWMVYGSYSGGIFIMELDPANGYPLAGSKLNAENNGYGRKLTGGYHTRIEAPYIQYVPDSGYYYLYVTFGGLDSFGGYNMRVARSEKPEGPYYDAKGNNMLSATASPGATFFDDKAIEPYGVKQLGNFVYSNLDRVASYPNYGYVSAGHNSTYYDDTTGKLLNIFHSRFPFRGEGHEIRVHQQFMNDKGWPVQAVHRYTGEALKPVRTADLVGGYQFVNHGKAITPDITPSVYVELYDDHTVGGAVKGTWELHGDYYARLTLDGQIYDGVFVNQWDPVTGKVVMTFTAISSDGAAVMGSQLSPLPDGQAVSNTAESLTLGNTSRVFSNLTLPTVGARNAVITWTSSNPSVVSASGVVVRPSAADGDVTVTLTATITKGTETATKSFDVTVAALPNDPLLDGIVGHYSFENSLVDGTGQLGQGIVTGNRINNTGGTITYGVGAVGQAAVFNGDSGIRLPDGLINSDTYSVSLWLNPAELVSFSTSFFGAASENSWISMVPQSWDNNLMLWSGTAWYDASTNTTLSANQWSHVVITVDKGAVKVYLNGVQRFSGINFPNVFQTTDGVFGLGVNYWDQPFKGSMDELRVYEIALSAEKVNQLYRVQPTSDVPVGKIDVGGDQKKVAIGGKLLPTVTVLPYNAGNSSLEWTSADPAIAIVNSITGEVTGVAIGSTVITATAKDGSGVTASYSVAVTGGLVAHYTFNNSLADASGQLSPGTVTGDRITNTGGSITYAEGKSGQAAVFDGKSGIRLPNGLISGNSYTVSMWLKPTVHHAFTTAFFGARTNSSWISLVPQAWDGNTMLWSGSDIWYDASANVRIPTGEWTLVTFTVDNGTAKLYLNGELKFTGGNFPNVFTNSNGVFALGVNYWDLPYTGLIDDLRIYNTSLNAEQVAELVQ